MIPPEGKMTDTVNRRLRVFLCHTSTDKLAVQDLYKQLVSDGIDAWLDKEKLQPGQKWQDEIPKAIRNSDIVIVCLSKNSTSKDGYVQKEIKFALDVADEKAEGSIYVIPARLEECDVPDRFSKYHWANLFEKTGYKKLLGALISQGEQVGITPVRSIDKVIKHVSAQYREEVLRPFFKYVKSGESFYIVSAPSAGKTRLVDFILGDDPEGVFSSENTDRNFTKNSYLGKDVAERTWLARVDINRIESNFNWGFSFYELLLHTILMVCYRQEQTEQNKKIEKELTTFHMEVIKSKDALTARRFFETAISILSQANNIRVVFIFDEFDRTYATMPSEVFFQLRAIRDANKYRIAYILFLHNLPESLRDISENESFFELISRNMIGLGPYSKMDTFHIIEQLEKRRNHDLTKESREWLWTNSGGHPGLIQALFTLIKEINPSTAQLNTLEWAAKQEIVRNEFRKIWMGLSEEEQDGLTKISHGDQAYISPTTGKLLLAKGMIKLSKERLICFTPLFDLWLKQ